MITYVGKVDGRESTGVEEDCQKCHGDGIDDIILSTGSISEYTLENSESYLAVVRQVLLPVCGVGVRGTI